MNLSDFAIDYGSFIRLKRFAFNKQNAEQRGFGSAKPINDDLVSLQTSISLLFKANKGLVVEGISAELRDNDGESELVIYTEEYMLVLSKVGDSSELYRAISAFKR